MTQTAWPWWAVKIGGNSCCCKTRGVLIITKTRQSAIASLCDRRYCFMLCLNAIFLPQAWCKNERSEQFVDMLTCLFQTKCNTRVVLPNYFELLHCISFSLSVPGKAFYLSRFPRKAFHRFSRRYVVVFSASPCSKICFWSSSKASTEALLRI